MKNKKGGKNADPPTFFIFTTIPQNVGIQTLLQLSAIGGPSFYFHIDLEQITCQRIFIQGFFGQFLSRCCNQELIHIFSSKYICRHLWSRHLNSFLHLSRFGIEIIHTVPIPRSEEHTSELQSRGHLVCRLLLEKT